MNRAYLQINMWRLRQTGIEKEKWALARIQLANGLLAAGNHEGGKDTYLSAVRTLDEAIGHRRLDNSVYDVLSVAPDRQRLVELYNALVESGALQQWQTTNNSQTP